MPVALTQRLYLAGKIDPVAPVIPAGKVDEVGLFFVALYDAIGTVRRAVADYDPLARFSFLRNNRLEGAFDIEFSSFLAAVSST